MIFTIVLVAMFVLAIIAIFAYQKIYNPGKLCKVCYRVVPEIVVAWGAEEEDGALDYHAKCPFCDSELNWDN